jgi:hypothetical protein
LIDALEEPPESVRKVKGMSVPFDADQMPLMRTLL